MEEALPFNRDVHVRVTPDVRVVRVRALRVDPQLPGRNSPLAAIASLIRLSVRSRSASSVSEAGRVAVGSQASQFRCTLRIVGRTPAGVALQAQAEASVSWFGVSKEDNEEGSARRPRSYAERLDPTGAIGAQAEALDQIANSPFGRLLLRSRGVDPAEIADARETYAQLITEPDRIAVALGPLGWIPHGLAHADAYGKAATLVQEGKPDEAEALLVETYAENDNVMIRFYHRINALYQGDERRREIGLARRRLLGEAYDLHTQERYAGAIPIVLAQIDGIFIDMTGKPAKTFYDSRNPNLVDDVTLAGHPFGLKVLSDLLSKEQRSTVVSDKLTRQGIMHGRVLGYDTLLNSTKVWAALIAVIEMVEPRARELNERAAQEHERRYADSKGLNEYGRRLDRRGFREARDLLDKVHLYQHGHYKRSARFAADRAALDPGRGLPSIDLELVTAEDSSAYHAWTETPTGVVFGFSQQDGDFNNYWVFVEEEPPVGGVGEDERWHHMSDPEGSPDW